MRFYLRFSVGRALSVNGVKRIKSLAEPLVFANPLLKCELQLKLKRKFLPSDPYIKHLLVTFTVFMVTITGARSQTVVAEFDLESNRVADIQAFPLGDSIFVSFSERDVKKTYWVNRKGEKREVHSLIPANAPIIGIQQRADRILYYYFLTEINKQVLLQAIEERPGTEESKLVHPIVILTGRLLAIDTDQNTVTAVSYMEKENQVRIVTVNGSKIEHKTLFDMPFGDRRWTKDNAGFVVNNEIANVQQGGRRLKLYHEGKDVVISLDEDRPGLENKRTTIVKMNVANGEQQVYELQRKDYDKFVSSYYEDKVYQFSHLPGKHLRCDVYDLISRKLLFTKLFEKDRSMREQKVIVHRGKSVEVGYTTLYEMVNMTEALPSIAVESTADSAGIRLFLGSVDDYVESATIPLPFFALGYTALLTLSLTPVYSNVRYFSLARNMEGGFDLEDLDNNPASSRRNFIDQYEISQTSGKAEGVAGWDLQFKGYLQLKDGVLGIYLMRGKKLILVKYH